MLKIGDFSKLAHVTVKALRHYESIGLLRPVWIDRFTGYRYYRLDQLPRLNRILALKELGFSLEQVGELLAENLNASRLRQLFDEQQAVLQERLKAEQTRLERVAGRLRQIEQEGSLPTYEVTVHPEPALTVAAMSVLLPQSADLHEQRPLLQRLIGEWANRVGLHASGPWITLYHNPAYNTHSLDIELALPVDGRPPSDLRTTRRSRWVGLRELPGMPQMARVVQPAHGGALETARQVLFTWAEHGGYQITGPLREIWLEEGAPVGASIEDEFNQPPPGEEPGAHLVEVQAPVESIQARKQKYFSLIQRKEAEMEPKFVHLPTLQIVGLRYYGKNENQEIGQLWGQFNQVSNQIQHATPEAAYGMCLMVPGAPNGEFEYVAGFNTTQADDIPAGMVVRQAPASRYAVFTHLGPLDTLRQTYDYIYHTWLPSSGLEVNGNWDFEYYTDEFKDFAPDSKFYIYIPVKDAAQA